MAINEAAESHIPKEERRNQTSHWMTTEIKDLMEQRRLVKNNKVQYNLVDKEINKKSKGGMARGEMPRGRKTQSQPEFQGNVQEDKQNCWQEIDASLEMY